jgi:RHS repeat-associated protein
VRSRDGDRCEELRSKKRYLPFGQVRPDVGSIMETDFGYTGQRDLDAQENIYSLGLIGYKARFYDSFITRFIPPDPL